MWLFSDVNQNNIAIVNSLRCNNIVKNSWIQAGLVVVTTCVVVADVPPPHYVGCQWPCSELSLHAAQRQHVKGEHHNMMVLNRIVYSKTSFSRHIMYHSRQNAMCQVQLADKYKVFYRGITNLWAFGKLMYIPQHIKGCTVTGKSQTFTLAVTWEDSMFARSVFVTPQHHSMQATLYRNVLT